MDNTATAGLTELAEDLLGYWERHGDNPEAVTKFAVQDLLDLARKVVAAVNRLRCRRPAWRARPRAPWHRAGTRLISSSRCSQPSSGTTPASS